MAIYSERTSCSYIFIFYFPIYAEDEDYNGEDADDKRGNHSDNDDNDDDDDDQCDNG